MGFDLKHLLRFHHDPLRFLPRKRMHVVEWDMLDLRAPKHSGKTYRI